jgi:hypothetical protein
MWLRAGSVLWALVLALLFLQPSSQQPQAGVQQPAHGRKRLCERSGYCSAGHVRRFVGDIAPSEGLWALVKAVSFKRELLFTIIDDGLSMATVFSLQEQELLQEG